MMISRLMEIGTLVMLVIVLGAGCSEVTPDTAVSMDDFASRRDELKKSLVKSGASSGRAGVQSATTTKESEVDSGTPLAGLAYQHEGRRDPFRSFQYEELTHADSQVGPLADYELSQLDVVAVVWDTKKARALIADPGGRAFVLHEGSQVGKNRGRVVAISDSSVSVRETYVDFEGQQSTKDVEMRIRGNQEG
jgi:Tfp pilus assembly protein PilP